MARRNSAADARHIYLLSTSTTATHFPVSAGSDSDSEGDGAGEPELTPREAYAQLWRVIRLPAVRTLAGVLLTFRLAVLPAEAAAPLKLLEKGVSKEALAGLASVLNPLLPLESVPGRGDRANTRRTMSSGVARAALVKQVEVEQAARTCDCNLI